MSHNLVTINFEGLHWPCQKIIKVLVIVKITFACYKDFSRNVLNESNNCEADLVDFVIDSSGRNWTGFLELSVL